MKKEKKSKKKTSGGTLKNRPKPSSPRAGYLASGRRYNDGGKICK